MMLDSIDNGPLVYPTVEENGQPRPKKYSELTEAQQLQDDCDVQATNIIFHGLPPDVYALVNYQEAAKDIWDRVKMRMKGTGLSYQEHECRLYNLFNKCAYVQGETLYEYYGRFSQLINDMHTIGMTMQQSPQHSSYSIYLPPQQFTPVYAAPIHHQHHYTLVNPQQHPVSPPPFISPLMTPQSQAEFPQLDSGLVVLMFQQGEYPIECINKAMAFLTVKSPFNKFKVDKFRVMLVQEIEELLLLQREMLQPRNATWFKEKLMLAEAKEAGQILDEEQHAFSRPCCDPEVLSEVAYSDSYSNYMINQDVQEMQYSEQTHDTTLSAPNDLLVLSLVEQMADHVAHLDKENQTNKMVNESLITELERYKERITIFEQRLNVDLNLREKLIDSQMDDLIRDRNAKLAAFQKKIHTLKETLSNNVKEKEFLSKTLTVFKTESIEKESNVIAKEHAVISMNDDEETLILEEEKQAFWFKHSSFFETPVTSHTPVRIEAPSKLPKVSLVNESLKKLKYQLANFDKVVKKRLTSDDITVGSWGFKHTKECFLTEIISFLKVLKDTFNAFDKTLLDEIIEVQTVFNQMEAAVDQCSVDKNIFEIQIKQLRIDNDQLLNQIMSQEIVHIVANSVDTLDVKMLFVNNCSKCLELETELFKQKDFIEKKAYDKLVKSYSNLEKHCISLELATQLNQKIFQMENTSENLNAPTFNQLFEINKLKAQSQEKDKVIRKLKERIKSLCGKDSVENVKKYIDKIKTIYIELEHRMFKLDIEAISPRLKNNRDAHEELLVYASQTCPNSPKPSEKLVAITPTNKDKRVRFAEPDTSLNNIPKQIDSLKTKDSNKPFIDFYRSKTYYYNALVKHSMRNAKFESMCAICNKCLFDANHDTCLVDFVNDVNKFLGTVRFGNDQVAKIMGYGDYQQGNVNISRVYYVEGLRHNLFSVGQFCDADLEVAFWKNTCFIQNLEGVDLLSDSCDTNLYTISLDDMQKTSPICLLSKASKTKN
ncbi:hypothetical protein Tco_0649721 [Tanacetum coccineum]